MANISSDKFERIRTLIFTADVPTYIRKSGISWSRAFELLVQEKKENGEYEVSRREVYAYLITSEMNCSYQT